MQKTFFFKEGFLLRKLGLFHKRFFAFNRYYFPLAGFAPGNFQEHPVQEVPVLHEIVSLKNPKTSCWSGHFCSSFRLCMSIT